eukprot:gnl/MRDRNA2_/MRDRNA2_85509_c0_seq1.p1 gnl/MRDRNA2_/MRDRNA2_85509_c0~~gnl/MRDRNA2_/MRDRNA2_85509_c0_seq1.p1  ORF type:complete len:259 (+),score=2.48 gnl/MRDRNA2_/MRDRNA2_85509_c0_seq1:1-777(+)
MLGSQLSVPRHAAQQVSMDTLADRLINKLSSKMLSPLDQKFYIPQSYYALRVERIACGTSHNDRIVGQIVLIDQNERLVYQAFIRPSGPVVSYLERTTGLNKDIIETLGISLDDAITGLKKLIPSSATLVGQNIRHDVQSLKLLPGKDFSGMMDLLGLYRIWNPKSRTCSVWSQDRLATVLLGWTTDENYSAASDALKTMRLFQLFFQLQDDPREWNKAVHSLKTAPVFPSFEHLNPSYEGVCLGNRKICICGDPFFT